MSRNGQRRKNVRPAVVKKVLDRQQQKERARVAKEIHKLQGLEAGDQNPHIQELKRQVSELLEQSNQLVDGHNELARSYNEYRSGMRQAIAHIDARIGALILVVDDFMKGGVENVTLAPANPDAPEERPGVYWQAYIQHYLNKLRELEARDKAAADAAGVAEPEAANQDGSPLVTPEGAELPSDEPDFVFGGDVDEAHTEKQESANV